MHILCGPLEQVAARNVVLRDIALIFVHVRLAILDLLGLEGISDGTLRLLLRLVLLVELSLALTMCAPQTGRVVD